MDIFVSALNTFILIVIFFYQKNRNKVLEERISEQTNLLSETKKVVDQQAKAILSQSSIVDSAIKYSEAFNVDKLEPLIRRQVSIEKDEEIRKIEDKYKNEANFNIKNSDEILHKLAESLSQDMSDKFSIPTIHYMKYLFSLSPQERDLVISKIENVKSREFIASMYDDAVVYIIEKS